jgi:hypothetical protein
MKLNCWLVHLVVKLLLCVSLILVYPWVQTKPTMRDFMPVLTSIERRLMGITPFTTYAGKLPLNNFVLSALPSYYMCVWRLPAETINKYRRHCLWRGSYLNKIGNCLAAWNKVQTPKSQGGMWIINMEAQSTTLLLKQLHKLFNKVDVSWVDLT